MSKLQLAGRPHVEFDPANKEHRRLFAHFQKQSTWGTCPVRFAVDETYVDLVSMMHAKLTQYYIKKEFEKSAKLAEKL